MRYENPDVPHHVNVSPGQSPHRVHPARCRPGTARGSSRNALYFGGGQLARLIPFTTEKSWVGRQRDSGVKLRPGAVATHDQVEATSRGSVRRLAARLDAATRT